jgi:hypothetical protein
MKSPKIGKITFAIVDIKGGRKALAKLLDGHKQRIPITLAGYLTSQWGSDDGTSIEFEMDVRRQRVKAAIPQTCHCIRCEAKRVEPKRKVGKHPALAAPYGKRKDRSDPEGGIPGRAL